MLVLAFNEDVSDLWPGQCVRMQIHLFPTHFLWVPLGQDCLNKGRAVLATHLLARDVKLLSSLSNVGGIRMKELGLGVSTPRFPGGAARGEINPLVSRCSAQSKNDFVLFSLGCLTKLKSQVPLFSHYGERTLGFFWFSQPSKSLPASNQTYPSL